MELNQQILEKIRDNWEVEISVLVSLLLQIILILSANLRKRSSEKWVAFVLWLAYLAADWVASFSLGIISSTLSQPGSNNNQDMLAFWTPFLLLHLGGPDNITAFSLEDSQLWLRHLLSLILQVTAAVYIFVRSLKPHSKLFYPTLFMFAAGVLKYGERTWSLKQARIDGLRNLLIKKRDAGPDYAGVMEDFSSNLRAGNPGMLTVGRENQKKPEYYEAMEQGLSNSNPRTDQEVVYRAYLFFQTFNCLFVDLILTFQDRNCSASIFSKCDPSQAYKMIETELSYAYDMLYTKALVVHSNLGRILRAISFCSTLIAFCLFFSTAKGADFKKKQIIISYVLLAGALALEFISIGRLILSDWTVAMLCKAKWSRLEKQIFQILSIFRRLHKHRWSHQMGQYSLLSYIADQKYENWEKFLDSLGMKEMWVEQKYIKYKMVSEEIERLTMEHLKKNWEKLQDSLRMKETLVEQKDIEYKMVREDIQRLTMEHLKKNWEKFKDSLGMKEILIEQKDIEYKMVSEEIERLTIKHLEKKWKEQTERLNNRQGQWALKLPEDCSMLQWSVDAEFDESLIMWHLATDICSLSVEKNMKSREKDIEYCEASKDLSHYLLYLLISRPSTMSAIAGLAVIRHGDTCEEAKDFFQKEGVCGNKYEAVKSLMNVHTFVRAEKVKGDKSKSILWDAVELARQLQDLGEDKMWKTACNVWIEMLFYAARHCRGNYHAQTLSAGGELLTFAWLLEAHFGMGGHYQIKSGEFTTSCTVER